MPINFSPIEQEAPALEFPCDYPIKVMGFASTDFKQQVIQIIQRHTATVCPERISVRESSKGSYVSITVIIEATGEEQLRNLFAELKNAASVKLVL